MANKLIYTYNGCDDGINSGYIPQSYLASYFDSFIIDNYNRTIWYQGTPLGNVAPGANRAEMFNDLEHNEAKGAYSAAFGYHTKTTNPYEVAFGRYNSSEKNLLFSIGNGTDDNHRHNAFAVDINGYTYISGVAEDISQSFVSLSNGSESQDARVIMYDFVTSSLERPTYSELLIGVHPSGIAFNETNEYETGSSYIYVPFGIQPQSSDKIFFDIRLGYVAAKINDTHSNTLGCCQKISHISAKAAGAPVGAYGNFTYTPIPHNGKYYTALYSIDADNNIIFSYTNYHEIPDNVVSDKFVYCDVHNDSLSIYASNVSKKYDGSSYEVDEADAKFYVDGVDHDVWSQMYFPQLLNNSDGNGKYTPSSGTGKTSIQYVSNNIRYPKVFVRYRFPIFFGFDDNSKNELMKNKKLIGDARVLCFNKLTDTEIVYADNDFNKFWIAYPNIFSSNDLDITLSTNSEYEFMNDITITCDSTQRLFGSFTLDKLNGINISSESQMDYTIISFACHNNIPFKKGKLMITGFKKA